MQPAARVQAAIELLDEIIVAARDGGAAADVIAARCFKTRRYAGSKDRRAIRELVWRAIREFGERPETARSAFVALADGDAELAALFTGVQHAPALIAADEARASIGLVPVWLQPLLESVVTGEEQAALLERAPLDLRINLARPVTVELPDGEPLPAPLHGLRLPGDTDLTQHPAQLAGAIEVQDAGSQWIAALCAVKPGMTVVDLCAGGGGKTLALAAVMQGEGRIIACDVDRARLSQLMPRAERAGVAALVETRLLNPNREMEQLADLVQQADIVLVDAPCSGTGTWRRNPEARWRLNPARLDRLKTMQRHVIDLAANLVASGGAMVYAVCSVLREEGDEQMVDWLTAHADWRVDDSVSLPVGRMLRTGRLLTPLHDATDGFFMARIDRV